MPRAGRWVPAPVTRDVCIGQTMATRTLTTWLGTWNLNGKPIVVPDGAARQWIVDDADADLYVFGLQELPALAVTSLLAESWPSDQYSSLIAPVLQVGDRAPPPPR